MTDTCPFGKKLVPTLCRSWFLTKIASFTTYHFKSLWFQLCYFLFFSSVGYLALKFLKPRTGYGPDNLDLFFTAVSAATVSSMSTLEMEVFSNSQLIVITILMFLGGEIFVSLLGLLIQRPKLPSPQEQEIELGTTVLPTSSKSFTNEQKQQTTLWNTFQKSFTSEHETELRYNSVRTLEYVVLGYLVAMHVVGPGCISAYVALNPSANNVLRSKGLALSTFSMFTTVSTFTNCGFLPTNENMMVFRNNSGLLLILIPQILFGNTLYPPCLRFILYALHRITKKNEYQHILDRHQELGYGHLMSSQRAWYLLGTVLVFLMGQFVAFTAMEWNSGVMEGMNSLQKVVGSLFQCVNSRHTGESIVDLSSISSAILLLFVVMMKIGF